MNKDRGLSLIEILIALIITGLIAACVSAAVLGGYYMLKQAEHKSRAMSITHVKLQEYLSKSFDGLEKDEGDVIQGDEADISKAFEETQDNTVFNWTVSVAPGTTGIVPYKNVTVQTRYTEFNPRHEPVSNRTVQLSNMVPYPLIHIQSQNDKWSPGQGTVAPHTTGEWGDSNFDYNWGSILNTAGVMKINYRVPKDLIIMYNLAIEYDFSNPPAKAGHTVYTRCRISDRSGTQGIITRTPIMTQVFINNILEIDNVGAGEKTISIEWSHEAPGTWVRLRAYDVTVVAVESKK